MFKAGDEVLYTKPTVGMKYKSQFVGRVLAAHNQKTLVEFLVNGKLVKRLLRNTSLKLLTKQ